jgi:hypothetical protein
VCVCGDGGGGGGSGGGLGECKMWLRLELWEYTQG